MILLAVTLTAPVAPGTLFLIREFVGLNGIVTMADNDLTQDLETPNIFAV